MCFPLNEENTQINGVKERAQTLAERKNGFGVPLMCIGFCSKTEESYRAANQPPRPGGYEGNKTGGKNNDDSQRRYSESND